MAFPEVIILLFLFQLPSILVSVIAAINAKTVTNKCGSTFRYLIGSCPDIFLLAPPLQDEVLLSILLIINSDTGHPPNADILLI